MKRVALCATTILALAATAAYAGSKSYSGPVDAGGTFSFTLVKHHHHLKVKRMTWDQVPATCEDGPHPIGGAFTDSRKVRHGKFKETGSNGFGGKFVITGTILGRGKARGRFRASGTLGTEDGTGNHSGCDTGKDHWRAHVH